MPDRRQVGGDRAAGQHAFAQLGELEGLPEPVPRAGVNAGADRRRPRRRGRGQRIGGTFQQVAAARPDRVIEAAGVLGIKQLDGGGSEVDFAGFKRMVAPVRRSLRFGRRGRAKLTAGPEGRRARGTAPKRRQPHLGAEGRNAVLQFLVDLPEPVGAVELVSGDAEAAEDAGEQERKP